MSARKVRGAKAGPKSQVGHKTKSQRLDFMARKKEERAVHRAYRKEQKAQAYLSEDENFESFKVQLAKLGLQLRDIPGDGNCLFRALGDQLDGNSHNHLKHRDQVVNYMIDHRDDFEPFVEDDVPFHRHVNNLKQPGTYAGNDTIVAFARLHEVNVVIHQVGSPCWEINGTEKPGSKQLHISYHNGDHYCSVRRMGDVTHQPAKIQVKCGNPGAAHNKKGGKSAAVAASPSGSWEDNDYMPPDAMQEMVLHVMQATGCQDETLISQMLSDQDYDLDRTIAMVMHINPQPGPAGSTAASVDMDGSGEVGDNTGLWDEAGTGTRLFGSSGGGGGKDLAASFGAKPKQLTTSHRKRQAKLEKKARATERKREQYLGMNLIGGNDNSDDEQVTVITQNVGMLEI